MDALLIKDFLADLFFPNRCPFCGEFIKWDMLSCGKCINKIKFTDDSYKLPECEYIDTCFTAVYYDGVAKNAVINLKIRPEKNFARLAASEIASKIFDNGFHNIDFAVAVPMSKKKYRKLGFNHSDIICDELALCLNIKKRTDILHKYNTDMEQHKMNAAKRLLNVKGLYYAEKDLNLGGKTILLCDDVVTTGATLNECARLLYENGAKKVIAAAAAKTVKNY